MLRGRVARQRCGRRRVLSAINAKAAQPYGPYIRLDPLAFVMGHKPHDRDGFSPELGAYVGHGLDTCQHRTLACVGILSVSGPCQGPDLTRGDPACLLGSSGLVLTGVRCSSAKVRTQRCFLGRIILLRHVVPLGLPMWWGRVLLSMRPRGAIRVQHLHTVEEGTPDLGYRHM
jgi:hypothetical protein